MLNGFKQINFLDKKDTGILKLELTVLGVLPHCAKQELLLALCVVEYSPKLRIIIILT